MKWVFQYGQEWTSSSAIKSNSYWLIRVCEDGSFYADFSDPKLTKYRKTMATLKEAQSYCESIEQQICQTGFRGRRVTTEIYTGEQQS